MFIKPCTYELIPFQVIWIEYIVIFIVAILVIPTLLGPPNLLQNFLKLLLNKYVSKVNFRYLEVLLLEMYFSVLLGFNAF